MPKKSILIFLLLLTIVSVAYASDYPALTPYVNDFAHVLTTEQISSLNAQCSDIEKRTTVEIAVVTINQTNGEDRVIYANRMGEASGVGKKATDNGVVVLWVISEEHGAIATGRGIESTLNDAKVGRIGRDSRQYFDKGDYYNGFKYILTEIDKVVDTNQTANNQSASSSGMSDLVLFLVIFGVIAFVILIIVLAVAGSDGGGGGGGDFHAGNVIGGSSHSSWSGGGFSGGGFGGGGSSF